jgi:hypothetical protein
VADGWAGLQADLEWRLTVLVAGLATESKDLLQLPVGAGRLVDGERVTTALSDDVDPRAVAGGVDAVGQPTAGPWRVRWRA